MSKADKLDLMGVSSLAFVAAAVLAAWMVTTPRGVEPMAGSASERAVSIAEDGRMKLTVTADRSEVLTPAAASTRTVSTRGSVASSLKTTLSIDAIR